MGQLAQQILSQLVIVDMQTKLVNAMPLEAMQSTIKNCSILTQAAQLLNVPIIVTEQYPQGLGATLPEIQQHFTQVKTNFKPIVKTAFSAIGEPKFNQQLHRDQSQIILAGMEAHICVLQTALSLKQMSKQVFVLEDAIVSRNPANKANAIARLREAGCVITNTESVLFEWLGNANHPAFKEVSKLIR
ncbi:MULTISPECIES: isochorismatase family protein [Methylotenera]|uniref:isochorismatase family protein n=1 Tax=Methylotenera TaxID=359407 RepID=UPI000361306F|nr:MULTISPECIES: isochorismatase family protein [Methylotenera]